MTCSRCVPLLSQYFDRVLGRDDREAVRAHLAECLSCAEHLRSYEVLEQQLVGALSIAPRPSLRNAVLAATSQRPVAMPGRRIGRTWGQVLMGGVSGACVAGLLLVLLAVAVQLNRQHNRTPSASLASMPLHPPRAIWTVTARQHATMPVVASAVRTETAALHGVRTSPIDRASLVSIRADARLVSGAVHGPLWSPDSASLLYLTDWKVDCRDGWWCGTLNIRTSGGSRVLATHVRSFAWSPDGASIVYAAESTAVSSLAEPQLLYLLAAGGGAARTLAGVDRTNVEWLPQGIIAARHGVVVRIDPRSGTIAPLPSMPKMRVADDNTAFFALSQNARFFAYQDATGLKIWDRGRAGLLVLRQPLSPLSEASFHFSWDGNGIFYSTFDDRYTMLYSQQLAPLGPATQLNNHLPLHGPITLVGPPSPDGSVLNFRIGSGAMAMNYVIDSSRGPAHRLLPPEGVGPVGWWSPDGLHLVYTVYRGDDALYSAIAAIH